jgi:hypothetical protein
MPDGDGDGNQEQRIRHIAELEALQEKRRSERNANGKHCKAIAQDG